MTVRVVVTDNDGRTATAAVTVSVGASPGDDGSDNEAQRKPEPLQLALWTDRPGYRASETVRLCRTLDLHDDRGRYRTFLYLERAGGGQRRYLAPPAADGELHSERVDYHGMPADLASPRILSATDRTLS